jgi:hypothetical protein
MKLRPELLPPILNEELVRRLAQIADHLDGSRPGEADLDLDEFNRLAGTDMGLDDFQGIYKAASPEEFVHDVLYRVRIKPVANVTHAELAEVVRRAMHDENLDQRGAYRVIFDANVPRKNASNLIFYPPDYDVSSNTWDAGRSIGEYDPTPEQIVEWALSPDPQS